MNRMESKVLEIVGRYKDGGIISIEDAEVIFEYCKSVSDTEHSCPKCVLHKKFGKCPVVISLP